MPTTLLLSPALADSLADAVRNGVPIETAAKAAGIGASTLYEWLYVSQTGQWRDGTSASEKSRQTLSAFSDAMQRARAEFEAKQVRGVVEAAEQVNEKTGLQDWRARAWLLNNHPATRKTYRPENQVKIEQTTTIRHEDRLAAQASLEELDAWSDAAAALPAPLE